MLVWLCSGILTAVRQSELALRFADTGERVHLHPPRLRSGYHLFLSHVWSHAQVRDRGLLMSSARFT